MLYLSRLLMRSTKFSSPAIIIISDRTDLDDQLSKDFTNAKDFIGDENIINIESRADLRSRLSGIESGGVFLTTVQKFAEDDEITVRLVYEGRSAKVNLDYNKVDEIEKYYKNAVAQGASEYHVELSQKAIAKMEVVLGDSDRIKAIAKDFINHYELRIGQLRFKTS